VDTASWVFIGGILLVGTVIGLMAAVLLVHVTDRDPEDRP
jgi:hypothetical protein